MTRKRNNPILAQASRGFSLAEMLVVLVLIGFIATLLMGGIGFGVRAWETSATREDQAQQVSAAQNLLRNLLQGTELVFKTAGSPELPVGGGLRGSEGDLVFVAPLPAGRGIGGAYEFSLSIIEQGEIQVVVLQWRPFRPDRSIPVYETGRVVVADSIKDLRFTYFGADAPGNAPSWVSAWTRRDALPQLVKIDLEPSDDQLVRWPTMLVALQNAAD